MTDNELSDAVVRVAQSIPRSRRPVYGIWISPETGVAAMPRAEMASRLAAAGLTDQAKEVTRRCRTADVILCWAEAGDAFDGDGAHAGFHSLRAP